MDTATLIIAHSDTAYATGPATQVHASGCRHLEGKDAYEWDFRRMSQSEAEADRSLRTAAWMDCALFG